MLETRTFDKERCRLAAFDIDGTLYTDGVPSEAVREALLKLHETGVMRVFSTGRHPKSIPESLSKLGCFKYVIGANGGRVEEIGTRRLIHESCFDHELAADIMRFVMSKTRLCHASLEEGVIITEECLEQLKRRVPKEFAGGQRISRDRPVDDPVKEIGILKQGVYKIGCNMTSREECSELIAEAKELFPLEGCITDFVGIEFTPKNVHKGNGLAALIKELNIDLEDIIVFGDSGNDIESMKLAGFAVAMGNGTEDVKAAADYVTKSVAEDGVAYAIGELFGLNLSC